MESSMEKLQDLVDTSVNLDTLTLAECRVQLAKECQVYVCGETYLAKRFDQINYKFCTKLEAQEVLVDNLYALLRFKYFPTSSEETEKRIEEIVKSFTKNLKTTLIRVSFDKDADCKIVDLLPDYCIAFRNGVYNFKDNNWYFKYQIIDMENLQNRLYTYDNTKIILWYCDFDFEPIIDINECPLEEFITIMKGTVKAMGHNYCFELLYNMSHNENDEFDFDKFMHLCEILGYSCLQSFSQYFVMLIGSGQNGKNSLFDGCFINRIVPRPASNDLDAIEEDRFITGALENKAHNFFLESSAKTYQESKMIKALTGSMYQTIESKGIQKYSGIINCKYIFAGNDQDKIKFKDNTTGFRRRINLYEINYQWDKQKRFLKRGDYYDTTFDDNLTVLKDDVTNAIMYIYFAMYGIKNATNNFSDNFKFSFNDWRLDYSDVDLDLKEKIEKLQWNTVLKYIHSNRERREECKTLFFSTDKERLYSSKEMLVYRVMDYDSLLEFFDNDEDVVDFFSENDVYMQVKILQEILGVEGSAGDFSSSIKKIYDIQSFKTLYNNRPYIKVNFLNGKLKIVK